MYSCKRVSMLAVNPDPELFFAVESWWSPVTRSWVLVKGCNLSYYKKQTVLVTIDPYYGDLN